MKRTPGHLPRFACGPRRGRRCGRRRSGRCRCCAAALRMPAPVTVAACAGGPLAIAVLRPRSRRRDVALFAMQMWAFTWSTSCPTTIRSACRSRLRSPLPDRRRPDDRRRRACRMPACSAALARLPRVGRLNRFLTWAHWLWFFEPYLALALRPAPPPRALSAGRAPDGRCLRRRLRRLLRAADRAAVVGLGAGADRRRGAADHGRGRGGHLGLGLAEDVRGARRQSLGGDALAAFRDLRRGGRSLWPRPAGSRGRSAGLTR